MPFCDFSSEDDNDEILAHGLDMGIADTQQIESQSDKLIYPNARITNATSMLLIMTFAVIHKLRKWRCTKRSSCTDRYALFNTP